MEISDSTSDTEIENRGELYLKWREKIKRGFLRIIVLKIFNTPTTDTIHPTYSGKDIVKHIKHHSIDNWEPSPGSIYPILNELEEDGIITFVRQEKKSKEYRITKVGQNLLAQIQEDSILFQSRHQEWQEEKINHFKRRFSEINMNRPLEEVKTDYKKYIMMAEILSNVIERRQTEEQPPRDNQ